MQAIDENYVTVSEAAALLRVAPSTIRRWIRQGELPAYRIGHRRVALRRADLSRLVTPTRPDEARDNDVGDVNEVARIKHRTLTAVEVARGLAAMDRAEQHAKDLQAQRDGQVWPGSVEIIHAMREERTRQLMEALGWDDLR
jgi:excisionase family DNA binding protein